MPDYFRLKFNFIMAFLAKSDAVRNNEPKFRKLSKRFDMMCVERATFLFTLLTGVIISFKNFFTPYIIFFTCSYKKIFRGNSVLPITSFFSYSCFTKASTGAKQTFFKTIFLAIIRLFTKSTYFIFTFSKLSIIINRIKFLFQTCNMASPTTINTFFNQRRINVKSAFTNWTNSIFASSFSHHLNYNSIEGVKQYGLF